MHNAGPAASSLPTPEEWAARLELKRTGAEWCGPCPLCGGIDRFHVGRKRDGTALVGCRGCIDGQPEAVRAKQFAELLRAVFPERFEPASRASGCRSALRPPRTPRTPPAPAEFPSEARGAAIAFARRLFDAAVPADGSLGCVYLSSRFAWPPTGIGPKLPASVRWLDRSRAPSKVDAVRWYGLPAGAAGCLVFAWVRPGPEEAATPRGKDDTTAAARLEAVSLLAVSADAERVPWLSSKRKIYVVGPRAGCVFEARASDPGETVHVAEGEISALALALAPWCEPGRVLATGTASSLPGIVEHLRGGDDRVVLHADGDPAGRRSAERARHEIEATRRECRIDWYCVGTDSADALGEWVCERAAIWEFEGGEARSDAEASAWGDFTRSEDDHEPA